MPIYEYTCASCEQQFREAQTHDPHGRSGPVPRVRRRVQPPAVGLLGLFQRLRRRGVRRARRWWRLRRLRPQRLRLLEDGLTRHRLRRAPRSTGAYIQIETGRSFRPISVGNSDSLRVGDQVIALGYPLGSLLSGMTPTVSVGIVSAKRAQADPPAERHSQGDREGHSPHDAAIGHCPPAGVGTGVGFSLRQSSRYSIISRS